VVVDQPEILDRMEMVLAQLDVPLVMKSIQMSHTSAAEVADVARKVLSEVGRLEVDADRNRIVVWDIGSKVDLAADVIHQYDQMPSTKTEIFRLNYASVEDVKTQGEYGALQDG